MSIARPKARHLILVLALMVIPLAALSKLFVSVNLTVFSLAATFLLFNIYWVLCARYRILYGDTNKSALWSYKWSLVVLLAQLVGESTFFGIIPEIAREFILITFGFCANEILSSKNKAVKPTEDGC